ncbi:MAG: hypothetical protein PHC61_12850, partial [Chitinivibrionales bacterium]|nr:hypothetical protein [Chitinivibrionales bacterium]
QKKKIENADAERSIIDCARIAGHELAGRVKKTLINKIEAGLLLPKNQRILHTAPHHDDIELAYFPLIHHLVRAPENKNYFCYMTSGFTSVTNAYLLILLIALQKMLRSGVLFKNTGLQELRDPAQSDADIHGYLNAIGRQDKEGQDLFTSRRFFRRLTNYLKSGRAPKVISFVNDTIATINALPEGAAPPEIVQTFKSWIREWEAELAWAHFGLGPEHVFHLRLPFYTDHIFPEDPDYKRDVVPILKLLENIKPTIVTVALDPESSGPDTHYKTLMAVSAALREYVRRRKPKNLHIWGYRNVWTRFHLSEVNMVVPVSLNSFAVLGNMFSTCFKSQMTASFPSYEYDGTFDQLAQKIWVEQFNDIAGLIGKQTFSESSHPMLRRTFGALYLKDMTYAQFVEATRPLARLVSAKKPLD